MEKVKIILPYDEESKEELQKAVESVEGATVNFDEGANMSGELVCGIVTATMNIPMLLVALVSLHDRFRTQKVRIVDLNDNPIKPNIKLSDIENLHLEDKNDCL